jgi:hypothetical protein
MPSARGRLIRPVASMLLEPSSETVLHRTFDRVLIGILNGAPSAASCPAKTRMLVIHPNPRSQFARSSC